MAASRTSAFACLALCLLSLLITACRPERTGATNHNADSPSRLRVVTWNIQKGEAGVDAMARALFELSPDVVMLQECVRSAAGDQAKQLAATLGLSVNCECGTLDNGRNQCIALLSRFPAHSVEPLRTRTDRAYGIAATIVLNQTDLRVACVHLAGTWKPELSHVAETFARRDEECADLARWAAEQTSPVVLAGDFNPLAESHVRLLERPLHRVVGHGPTFPSANPMFEFDRVFHSASIRLICATAPPSDLSDHRSVVADFEIPARERGAP